MSSSRNWTGDRCHWTGKQAKKTEIAGTGSVPRRTRRLGSIDGDEHLRGSRGGGLPGVALGEYLLKQGHRVVCLDNLETGSLQNIEHLRDEGFEFRNVDISEQVDVREAVKLIFHLASTGQPDRLPAAAAADAEGRVVRHA